MNIENDFKLEKWIRRKIWELYGKHSLLGNQRKIFYNYSVSIKNYSIRKIKIQWPVCFSSMFQLFVSIQTVLSRNPWAVDLANFDSIQFDGLFSDPCTAQNPTALYVPEKVMLIDISDLTSNRMSYVQHSNLKSVNKIANVWKDEQRVTSVIGNKLTYVTSVKFH